MSRLLLRFSLSILLCLLVAGPGWTTAFRSGATVTIGPGEVIDDDLFVAGQSILIQGTVRGDLMAVGSTIQVHGTVQGSVMAAGQSVVISGNVTDSVRAAGQSVRVGGMVGRNLALAGQNVTMDNTARVARDLNAAASVITMDGRVGRTMGIAAATAQVNGSVGQGLRFEGDRIVLGSSARVNGPLVSRSTRAPEIAGGAVVTGGVQKLPPRVKPSEQRRRPVLGGFVGNFFLALALYIVGAVGLALAPSYLQQTVAVLRAQPGWCVLWGFILLVVIPIAAIILCITVIGIPLGLAALSLWGFAILFSAIPVAIFLGRWIYSALRHGATVSPFAELAIGLLLLAIAGSIPVLGGLMRFAVALFGLGMFALAAARRSAAGGAEA